MRSSRNEFIIGAFTSLAGNAAVLGLCLAGVFAAYLTLLNCYPSGPMGPSTCF
ncbi:MAG TPA: hypothetical protein PKW33_17130 [Anaerolineaceae bacterium]|nr:hypothetical protein [Anaerolineaceae bacterium]HPN53323.1 hypothetical protein [Anaerolineaceae bacterium]